MFRWFKSWFSRSAMPYDVYRPKERMIYSFWNGEKIVTADPLVLYKRVMDCGPELAIDMKVSKSASKDATKAHGKAIDKIRNIFKIKEIEQGGLTELEGMDLLDHFLTYCDVVKKNSSILPMQSTSTVDSPTTSQENPPTSNSSVSGSIANDPSTDGQPS